MPEAKHFFKFSKINTTRVQALDDSQNLSKITKGLPTYTMS